MKSALGVAIIVILSCINCIPQTKPIEANTGSANVKLEKMSESLETHYALSALPTRMRDAATVYLLDPSKGYSLSRKGTNGFSCIVVRSDWQFPKQEFRDDIF
jgi:hypothetical protein